MNDSTPFDTIGDEPLEARIVAWVLGEASAFEAAELERLCEERPELLVFRRRMRALHGLLTETEAAEPDDAWKLPAVKRKALDELFGEETPVRPQQDKELQIRRSGRRALLAIAACVMLTLFLGAVFSTGSASIQKARKSKQAAEFFSAQSSDFLPGGARETKEFEMPALPMPDSPAFANEAAPILGSSTLSSSPNEMARQSTTFRRFVADGKASDVDVAMSSSAPADSEPVTEGENAALNGRSEIAGLVEDFGVNRNSDAERPARSRAVARVDSNVVMPDPTSGPSQLAPGSATFGIPGSDKTVRQDNLDAVLDHRNGIVGEIRSSSASASEPALPEYALKLDSKAASGGKEVTKGFEMSERFQWQLSARPAAASSAADPSKIEAKDAEVGNLAPEMALNEEVFFRQSSSPEKEPLAGDELQAAKSLFPQEKEQLMFADREIAALKKRAGSLRKQLEDPALNDSKKQTQFKEWQETQEKLKELVKVKDAEVKEEVLDERALEEKSVKLRRTLEDQTGGDYNKQSVFRQWQETQVKLQEIAKAKTAPAKKSPLEFIEETAASEEPYSTFSLNINDASFQIAKAALEKGERPDPEAVKVEQFYNAVDYGDPAPATNEPVAARMEQAAHPIIPGRNLVRVSLKTAAAGRGASQPLRLTLLVDQSGSMVREDRRTAMSNALKQLGGLLTPNDHITVVGFSRESHLLADNWTGDKAGKLGDLVNQTASEGGTNLEQAINLAEQMAARPHPVGEQNRIVLFTDGAANLGNANPARLAERVKSLRQQGIAFDIAGIGADGVNDRLLSELARNGNGRYYVVSDEKNESFARQLAGAFRPAAENVKVQVHFNPERVGRYKLIGFEKDRLKTEDFRNDVVDAAELAAEEAGVAIYQVETLPQGSGEIGEVSVRFRDTSKGEMVERKWTMPFESTTQAFDRATPSMQLAGLSMLAAEKLKGGPLADAIDFKQLSGSQSLVKHFYGSSPRVADMLHVIDLLK